MHCIDVHKFSTNFKFDDYKKVVKSDVKRSHQRKKSKPKAAPVIRSKVSSQITSRNNGSQKSSNNAMELEFDEKMDLDKNSSLGNKEAHQSFKKQDDPNKQAAKVANAKEERHILNKTHCDKKTTVTKCKLLK